METLQTLLNYAAIAPFILAAGMFIDYCWRRSTPRPVQAVVKPAQNTQELNSDPKDHAYHLVEDSEYFQAIPDQGKIEMEEALNSGTKQVAKQKPEISEVKPPLAVQQVAKRKRGRPPKNKIAIAS